MHYQKNMHYRKSIHYRNICLILIVPLVLSIATGDAWGQQMSETTNRFLWAVREGNQDVVNMMLEVKDVSVDVRDAGDRNALHYAIKFGQTGMVRLLLKHGCDSRARDERNMFPLMIAVLENNVEVAQMLLDSGVPVDDTGFYSQSDGETDSTALIMAAQTGAYEVAELLLAQGANVNAVSAFERTALFWANKEGQSRVAELLEQHGGVTDPDLARELSAKRASSPEPDHDEGSGTPELSQVENSAWNDLYDRAGVLAKEARYDEALAAAREALTVAGEVFGPQSSQVVRTHNRLGQILVKQGKLKEAGQCYHQALSVWKEVPDKKSADQAEVCYNFGLLYKRQKNFKQAGKLLSRALKIYRTLDGYRNKSQTASAMLEIADIYYQMGKEDKARTMKKRAAEILRQIEEDYPEHEK